MSQLTDLPLSHLQLSKLKTDKQKRLIDNTSTSMKNSQRSIMPVAITTLDFSSSTVSIIIEANCEKTQSKAKFTAHESNNFSKNLSPADTF